MLKQSFKWLISEKANIWTHGASWEAMLLTSMLYHSSALFNLSDSSLWEGKDCDD